MRGGAMGIPPKDGKHPQSPPAVPIEPATPPDPDWYERIQRAKEAREAGIRQRKGKPTAVITRLSPT